MDNHSSKTANIRGFYLAYNTLLGLNELKHSLTAVNVFLPISNSYGTSTSSEQLRQSNVYLALQ
jgi:hypothetical protein